MRHIQTPGMVHFSFEFGAQKCHFMLKRIYFLLLKLEQLFLICTFSISNQICTKY